MVKSLVGGYRASRKEPVVLPDVEEQDSVSIVSMPKDRSERIKTINSWKDSRKKKNDMSCADSVLSDISFNAGGQVPREISGSSIGINQTHEFILECENEERIYVPSLQGMIVKARCQHLQFSLETNKTNSMAYGGASDSPENRIITMKKWSSRTARHILELLSEGVTWIENDQNRFVDILRACDEINVRLRLGSPINHHDILDAGSSLRFFKLSEESNYRFELAGNITSSQWMGLMRKGILLGLDSNLIMLTDSPSPEICEDADAIQQRLSKCDNLYSEFSVYSKRSTVNTLYTILGVLSINDTKSKSAKSNSAKAEHFGESIQIVCKTVAGGLREKDWNMLWRMTSASYTLSTPEEKRLLQHSDAGYRSSKPTLGDIRICESADSTSSTVSLTASDRTTTSRTESMDDEDSRCSHDLPSSVPPSKLSAKLSRGRASSSKPKHPIKHETRTIIGTSFVALKHLFHPVNRPNKSSSKNHDPSLLPACLSIANPSPDTLGRFLNACAATPSTISEGTTTTIGYDILPPSSSTNCKNGIMFFVSNTSERVKEILDCMADYSGTSDVGEINFRLEQLR